MLNDGGLSVVSATVVVTTVAAGVGCAMLILLFIKRNGVDRVPGKRYPPSLPTLPLIAAILREGAGVLPGYFMSCAQKLGPVLSCNLGGRLTVILNSTEALTDALVRQSEIFPNRVEFWTEKNISNIDLRGIVFQNYNENFKKNRKISLSILKEFGFGISNISETRILHEVESLMEAIKKTDGLSFNPKHMMDRAASSVVLSILFGRQFVSDERMHSELIKGVHEFNNNLEAALNMVPSLRFLPSFRKRIDAFRQGNDDMLRVIDKAIEISTAEESESTFVRRYLEIEGPGYDQQELRYILRDLCLGNSETTSTILQWALVELSNHPEVQNHIQRELDDVVPEQRFPSLNDKPRLPYAEAVILELMRRRTVVPLPIPRVSCKDCEVLGWSVPKGSLILVNIFGAHLSPLDWNHPEKFDPERFLDKDNNLIGSERILPFGLGRRSCPGEVLARQELFLFLTSLFQRFNVRPPLDQDSIEVKEIASVTMHPSDFEVRLIPRKKY